MPLRSMAYDTAEYERQATGIRKQVRRQKGISRPEFLSGFTRENKLIPCITLVLYYGNDWDGSHDLHGILDMDGIPDELKPYINNYSIHLIEVRKLENTAVFQTDLKQIFDFIRYSEDKMKLKELVSSDSAYQNMDEEAYDMAASYAKADELLSIKQFHEREGKINMCKAIQDMLADERAEGRHEGRQEGQLEIILKLYHNGDISLETACMHLNLTAEEFLRKINEKN